MCAGYGVVGVSNPKKIKMSLSWTRNLVFVNFLVVMVVVAVLNFAVVKSVLLFVR